MDIVKATQKGYHVDNTEDSYGNRTINRQPNGWRRKHEEIAGESQGEIADHH